jgi:hypothetical protein
MVKLIALTCPVPKGDDDVCILGKVILAPRQDVDNYGWPTIGVATEREKDGRIRKGARAGTEGRRQTRHDRHACRTLVRSDYPGARGGRATKEIK